MEKRGRRKRDKIKIGKKSEKGTENYGMGGKKEGEMIDEIGEKKAVKERVVVRGKGPALGMCLGPRNIWIRPWGGGALLIVVYG